MRCRGFFHFRAKCQVPSAKGGGTMAIDIDSLQIQIEATSSDAEKKIDSLTRRSKSLLASFFAFEDDGLNLLQFATASGYRLGHMVLRKSEGLFPLSTHLCYNKTQSSPVYSIPANNNEVCMTNLHKYGSSKCLSYDRQGLQNCETTAVRVCYFFAAFF